MQTRKLKLIVLAGLVLAVSSSSALARDRWNGRENDRWNGHDRGHSRVSIVFSTPHTRVVAYSPYRSVFVRPTTVFVAPQPFVTAVAAAPVVTSQAVSVWFTNLNGSRSNVTLTKDPYTPGYTGPKGEYYTSMPTEEQLRMVYGI
jgi:hypothetical protein